MTSNGPIRLILAISIGVWVVAVAGLYCMLLAVILPRPGSHDAADAMLGAIVMSPLIPVELIGLVALAGLWRGWRATPYFAIGWGILQSLVALLALAAPSGNAALVLVVLALFAFVGLAAAVGLLPPRQPRPRVGPRRGVSAGR